MQAPGRAAASRRLALRARERGVHRSRFRSWGYDTRIEKFDVLFPTPKTRVLEMVAPTRYKAAPDRARADGGRDLGPGRRAAPDLQRLLDRRRRDGELVYVNYGVPAGLRGARAPRHRREGQDRHRALRRLLARHQAEGRGRARRDRLPHLLRPARRRLLPGRRLPEGRRSARARARSAARSRTCRSSRAIPDAGRRRHAGREAPRRARTRRR